MQKSLVCAPKSQKTLTPNLDQILIPLLNYTHVNLPNVAPKQYQCANNLFSPVFM